MERIKVKFDSSTCKGVLNCANDCDEFNRINEHFSAPNEGAHFARRRGHYYVPLRSYAITKGRRFEIGLFDDIQKFCTQEQLAILEPDEEFLSHYKIPYDANIVDDLNLDHRDYQYEMLKSALDQGRGIVEHGTGAGKTFETASLIESIYRVSDPVQFKCIVVVPDLGLVKQTYDEFNKFGVSFSSCKWTGKNELDETSNVVIVNAGCLISRIHTNDWVFDVDLAIVDECHKIKSNNKLSKLITKIRTPHKFGLTGTLPVNNKDRWSVVGKLGPVIHVKSSYDLRSEGHLTHAKVYLIKVNYKTQPKRSRRKSGWECELDFIYNNSFRNNIISNICDKFKDKSKLILVNHLTHGDILQEILPGSPFIKGEMEVDERAQIINDIENNKCKTVIAMSSIFSTGINIKNLHCIIFAAGGKSFIRTVQGIGRGLRLHESKEKLLIIDIADMLNYSVEHWSSRISIYNDQHIPISTKSVTES